MSIAGFRKMPVISNVVASSAITENTRLRDIPRPWWHDFDLTPSVMSVLVDEQIKTVGELIRFVENDGLTNRKNVGPKRIARCKRFCEKLESLLEK